MSDSGPLSFADALQGRIDHILDACTRCGDCVRACPMAEPAGLDPANATGIAGGILDLLSGGAGTPDAERWAEVCTNSGKCIPACAHGINPRLMVNMARIAARAKLGEANVRRAANQYFNAMSRGTRTIARLQLPPDVLARINPPLRAAEAYDRSPDIVFYTGCNVIKTPHIALLVLEVLDALGVSYEVMGGTAICCGIQQFKQGDLKTAGRVGYNTIERLVRPGAARILSWCPSCQIQIGEVALPAYAESHGAMPFDLSPITEFLAERLDDLRPLFVHPVNKRVALQERSALPGIMVAVKQILGAIPGLEVVTLDVPVLSTQANHLVCAAKVQGRAAAAGIPGRGGGRRDDVCLDLPRVPWGARGVPAGSRVRAAELHETDWRKHGPARCGPLQAPQPDGGCGCGRCGLSRHDRHLRAGPGDGARCSGARPVRGPSAATAIRLKRPLMCHF